jgi:hypothetical protein
MTMNLDPTQFDVRENTASLRRHASLLVINSSNSESLSTDALERAQSSLRLSPSAKALDLPVTETQNGATGGKEESGMDQRRDCQAQTPFAGGNAKFEPLLECEDAARLLGNIPSRHFSATREMEVSPAIESRAAGIFAQQRWTYGCNLG